MNILLVNPRGVYFDEGKSAYKRLSFPMGLMHLSSAVKRIQFDQSGNWDTQETDNPNRQVTLIDAAAEGYGDENGEGDPLIYRNNKRIRQFGLSDEQIISKAKSTNPDVIFVTGQFTKQLDEFYATTRLLKEHFPGSLIVGGGPAASTLDKSPLSLEDIDNEGMLELRKRTECQPYENGVDFIVSGEGEVTAAMLIDRLEAMVADGSIERSSLSQIDQARLADIPNLVLKPTQPDGLPKRTKESMISEAEYNRLPFPDVSIVDRKSYNRFRTHYGEAKSNNWIELFTSRGCSKNCTFCASKPYFKTYRKLSDQRVQQQLQYYRDNGFDEVCVEDDSILDYPARATRIFRMIKDAGFKQFTAIGGIEFKHLLFNSHGEKYYFHKGRGEEEKWFLSQAEYEEETKDMPPEIADRLYAELVDGEDLIKSMSSDIDPETGESKENGCYRVYLAMESANLETLKEIGKIRDFPPGPNGESHKRPESAAIELLAKYGIETHGGMMIGNPKTEGIPELMHDFRFCREMMEKGLTRIAFFPYVMLPGAPMVADNLNPTYYGQPPYARVRTDYGYLTYGYDSTNMDSIKYGWTAEELITVSYWANNLFAAGEGRNWGKGKTISAEELEERMSVISDPEILYQLTSLRLMKEGGQPALEIYHNAIKSIRGELPTWAYNIKESQSLTDEQRELMVKQADAIAQKIEGPDVRVDHDKRIEYARDTLEFAMRAPEIKVVPSEQTLIVQESSDYDENFEVNPPTEAEKEEFDKLLAPEHEPSPLVKS